MNRIVDKRLVGADSRVGCYVEYKVEFVDSRKVVQTSEWVVADQLRAMHDMIDLFEKENCRRSEKHRDRQ